MPTPYKTSYKFFIESINKFAVICLLFKKSINQLLHLQQSVIVFRRLILLLYIIKPLSVLMNNRSLLLILCLLPFLGANAQQKWTLQQCVEYAISNNISVKQADVQARVDKLTLKQSVMSPHFLV